MSQTSENLHIFVKNNEKITKNNQFDKKNNKLINLTDLS